MQPLKMWTAPYFLIRAFNAEKWRKAAQAAKEAIAACEELGTNLYEFPTPVRPLSNTTMIQMSIRNAVTEKWNREIIWGIRIRGHGSCSTLPWRISIRIMPATTASTVPWPRNQNH